VAFDQARFDQLSEKRFEDGLSDDEENELGRLFAEKEGKSYSNSQMQREGGAAMPPVGAERTDLEPPPKAEPGQGPQPAAERPIPPDERDREIRGEE
jgi:hypothetical protein